MVKVNASQAVLPRGEHANNLLGFDEAALRLAFDQPVRGRWRRFAGRQSLRSRSPVPPTSISARRLSRSKSNPQRHSDGTAGDPHDACSPVTVAGMLDHLFACNLANMR